MGKPLFSRVEAAALRVALRAVIDHGDICDVVAGAKRLTAQGQARGAHGDGFTVECDSRGVTVTEPAQVKVPWSRVRQIITAGLDGGNYNPTALEGVLRGELGRARAERDAILRRGIDALSPPLVEARYETQVVVAPAVIDLLGGYRQRENAPTRGPSHMIVDHDRVVAAAHNGTPIYDVLVSSGWWDFHDGEFPEHLEHDMRAAAIEAWPAFDGDRAAEILHRASIPVDDALTALADPGEPPADRGPNPRGDGLDRLRAELPSALVAPGPHGIVVATAVVDLLGSYPDRMNALGPDDHQADLWLILDHDVAVGTVLADGHLPAALNESGWWDHEVDGDFPDDLHIAMRSAVLAAAPGFSADRTAQILHHAGTPRDEAFRELEALTRPAAPPAAGQAAEQPSLPVLADQPSAGPAAPAAPDPAGDPAAPVASLFEANQLTEEIRVQGKQLWNTVALAYRKRVWVPLGYDSWDAYCDGELDGRIAVPREDRAEVVQSLRDAGLSTRAIAAAAGTSEATVRRDLAETSGASNDAPDGRPQVTGKDGKSYPATKPPKAATSQPHPCGRQGCMAWAPPALDFCDHHQALLDAGEPVDDDWYGPCATDGCDGIVTEPYDYACKDCEAQILADPDSDHAVGPDGQPWEQLAIDVPPAATGADDAELVDAELVDDDAPTGAGSVPTAIHNGDVWPIPDLAEVLVDQLAYITRDLAELVAGAEFPDAPARTHDEVRAAAIEAQAVLSQVLGVLDHVGPAVTDTDASGSPGVAA